MGRKTTDFHECCWEKLNNSTTMKKVIVLATALVFSMLAASAQDTKQKMKETGHQAKETTKAAGRKIGREADKAGDKISTAAHNTKQDIKAGTNRTLDKADHKMKKAERKLNNSK